MADQNPPPAQAFYEALIERINAPRQQTTKSIPCETYKSGQDFDLWVVTFIDNVRAVNGLTATDARLNNLCLNWISTKLEVGPTRSVYDNLPQTAKANWPALKQALSDAYKDESEEILFLSRDDAWKRNGMPLIDFKNGLLHRMQKYQPDLKTVQGEWDRTAVRRFRAGLQNPYLEAHILMSCVGNNNNLDHAYSVAANYENTLQTLGQSGNKMVPNLATMFNVPQTAALAEAPQFSALSPFQEKVNDRLVALETASKKQELDVSELKAGLTEVRDGVKTIKEEIVQNKFSARPVYQRPLRPLYPVVRAPVSSYARPQYQYQSQAPRPRVVPGLTGGPGYLSHQPTPITQQGHQPQRLAQETYTNPSPQIGPNRASSQGQTQASGPVLAAAEDCEQKHDTQAPFANPNLQYGYYDAGYGWTGTDLNDASAQGYDLAPDGVYVYSDMPF